MLSDLTKAQRLLSTWTITRLHCEHCNQHVVMTYIDLLWRKVSKRYWFDVEMARYWYNEELRSRGLLREYNNNGLEKYGHRGKDIIQ